MSVPPDPLRDDAEPDDSALREHAQYWVARLVAKDISASELDTLEAWIAADARHARAFSCERALWQDLGAVADALPAPAPTRPIIRTMPIAITRRRLMHAAPAALAASLALAFFGPSLMIDLRADHRTATGEVRSIALPDGTTAMLDSGSAISVAFDGDRRTVHLLAGRAWFDVHHEGRPFMVEALDGETRDIGTGFEVRRDGGAVEVGVTNGMVQVRAPGRSDGPTLRAGERVRYTADGMATLPAEPATQLAMWRRGELSIEQQPVRSAIAEIARYRSAPVWMIGDFSASEPVSGLFLIQRPDEALETIVKMRGLRTLRLPGGALIVRPNSAT